MKILAIRGKNLASLEGVFELDFTAEPLASAGIFAITGQTGSGKSTILDALCLALFDDTPRLHNATEAGVEIADVRDKTIRQDDCRSILRRGAVEGYAEADFLSLGGERFRARWLVVRTQGRTDGSLHNSVITLKNLSTREEVHGTKRELLARITTLIGLTFDQFTRAVLLAQGDFSSFLKAKSKEKAELLEKLTGTEIYSRISALIYDQTKRAEQEYEIMNQRLKDIETLPDEQVDALTGEQEEAEKSARTLDEQIKVADAKIKWIDECERLQQSLAEAKTALVGMKNTVFEARPRYDYLAKTDSVQSVRDIFHRWQELRRQLGENRTALDAKHGELEREKTSKERNKAGCDVLDEQLNIIEEAYLRLEPEIRRAQELDIQIAHARNREAEVRKEYAEAETMTQKHESDLQKINTTLEATLKEKERLQRWKSEHLPFQALITQSDALLGSLKSIRDALAEMEINRQLCEQESHLLRVDTERMEQLKAEQERLNRLLPAGVATLRKALQEGEPCPVCGSVHHPYRDKSEEIASDEKPDEQKQAVTDEMNTLAEAIEHRNKRVTSLSTLVQEYRRLRDDRMREIETVMAVIPSWRDELAGDALLRRIEQLVRQWTTCEERMQQTGEAVSVLKAQLAGGRDRCREATDTQALKANKLKEAEKEVVARQKERATLLNGYSAEELKIRYENKKRDVMQQQKLSQDKQVDLNRKVAELNGSISALEQAGRQLTQQYSALSEEKDAWAVGQQTAYTDEQLAGFFSKTAHWIEMERQALSDLQMHVDKAQATLDERMKNLAQHERITPKPDGEQETKALLTDFRRDTERLLEKARERKAEIVQTLKKNDENKARSEEGRRELIETENRLRHRQKLNDLLGARDGAKFKKIAQEYTLDFLLTYANVHLHTLSQRYELQRIPNTLALQVTDLEMFNNVRTVHSLSGGESFLVSLSLALGLSSLSSNRMKIESLFIDEGFGMLDADTLRMAMDALENLQTQGRKIGVISHVEEMTERIAVQIRVTPSSAPSAQGAYQVRATHLAMATL